MSAMTLSGRESPSAKKIDVEANLLEDWIAERRRTARDIQLRIVAVLGVAAAGIWAFSALSQWKAGFASKEHPVAQRLHAIRQQLVQVQPSGTAISEAEIEKMIATSRTHADAFVAQVIALMNSAPSSMAISAIKIDVLGGEMKMTGQADAENYYAANEFILRNNDPAKGMSSTQTSTSRSDLLGTDGVAFQFVKKVKVSQ